MNTVKRWLAGFLSFAMIFTSAAFTNVGALNVFASKANPQQQAAGDVAKVTIDNTVTYWETMELAVDEANEALENADGYKKSISIDLLDDADIDWYHRISNNVYDGKQVRIPLVINLNGYTLTETNSDNYRWGSYTAGGNTFKVCPSYIYNDATLVSIKFATHNPSYTFNWELDTDAKTWSVVSYREKCPNCGDGEEDVILGANGRFTNNSSGTTAVYRANHPLLAGYFKTDFVDASNTYEFNQYKEAPFTTENYVKTWSVLNAKEGYALPDNPTFDADGSMLKHDADGKPIPLANIYVMADGSTVENPDITITAATDTEMRNAGIILNGSASADKTYYIEEAAKAGQTNSIKNVAATCTSYGVKWYRVVVKDPNGKVLFDKLMVDYQADGIKDHKAGRITGVEVLRRGARVNTQGFATEAEALAAAGNNAVVKITKDRIDWNDDGDYTDNGDFNGYYYWYWDGLTPIPSSNSGNAQVNAYASNRERIRFAVDENGDFVYRFVHSCYWVDTEPRTIVYGEEKKAELLKNLGTNAADLTAANNAIVNNDRPRNWEGIDNRGNNAFSTCTLWNYKSISEKCSYELWNGTTITVVRDEVFSFDFSAVIKPRKAFSHNPGNNTVVKTDGNCYTPAAESFDCAICNRENVTVYGETTNDHKFVAITPAQAAGLTVQNIDPALTEVQEGTNKSAHSLTWNSDYTVATISPTCTEDGGEYQYCANGETPQGNFGTGHWVCTKVATATGHKLSMIALTPDWNENPIDRKPYFTVGQDYTYNAYSAKKDYQFYTTMTCGNDNCSKNISVRFHSIDGTDTITKTAAGRFNGAGIAEIYNGIDVEKQKVGKDCLTDAKIVWTVKDVVDANGKPITKEATNPTGSKGPHTLKDITWKWSEDFKQATGTGTCTVCKESGKTVEVTTEQVTSADGITTFTAKNGNESESKKAYSLKDAVVTFDKSLVTDINLLNGITGAASQAPDVTVTINGTVINPDLYDVDWNVTGNRAYAEVKWTADVEASTAAEHVKATAKSETIQAEAKNKITGVGFTLYANDEKTDVWTNEYDPAVTYVIKTKSVPSNVTVKYAVRNKEVTGEDQESIQKKIEALTYDQDKVEFKEVGKYFVYAQITKEGYTTYTTYAGKPVIIAERNIQVYVNNLEMTVGETPVLEKAAYDSKGRKIDVDWDAENFKFTAAGGKEFKDLSAGTYLIWVEAPNYIVTNSGASGENRVGTITVKAKTDDQKVAEEVIADLIAAGTDADKLAAAFEKFSKLTDAQKQIVKANNEANAQLAPAEKAYNDKKAAEEEAAKKAAEKKALDDATAAGKNAIASANAYASDATIKALIDALNAAIAKKDTAAIQKATADLNNAVASKKAAPAKKSTPSVKISTKSKTYKAKDLKKKAKSFKIKYSKTSGSGKATFKKSSGSKKLKVSKAGKITVKKGTKKGTYKIKVKLTVAANSKFNAKTVKKTIKVKVK